MDYDFEQVKKDFMEVDSPEEWEAVKLKYPGFKISSMDHEMKQHMNRLIRALATQEQIQNPHIHLDTA